jgi:hypothetical protein
LKSPYLQFSFTFFIEYRETLEARRYSTYRNDANNLHSQMPKRKQTVGGRVEPKKREWIEREAEKRDRSISYIVNELITESIKRREQEREEAVPA